MRSELYQKVEQFVVDSFTKAGNIEGIKHLKRTVYWVLQLKSDADEALLISAIAHDIERVFRNPNYIEELKKSERGFRDEGRINHHQEEGAEIIANFLKSQEANKELIERVKMLVSKHEVGGNDEQNLLKDADSMSFFENNVEYFISNLAPKVGADKVKEKFKWMFGRISSEKAKEIARLWYEDAMRQLNAY